MYGAFYKTASHLACSSALITYLSALRHLGEVENAYVCYQLPPNSSFLENVSESPCPCPGTGKTHLAGVVAGRAINNGSTVIFERRVTSGSKLQISYFRMTKQGRCLRYHLRSLRLGS